MSQIRGGHSLWPTFEGGHDEERDHGCADVIKVEVVVAPDALLGHWLRRISLLVVDELASALGLRHLRQVITAVEGALEELDSDNGEHELKWRGYEGKRGGRVTWSMKVTSIMFPMVLTATMTHCTTCFSPLARLMARRGRNTLSTLERELNGK